MDLKKVNINHRSIKGLRAKYERTVTEVRLNLDGAHKAHIPPEMHNLSSFYD